MVVHLPLFIGTGSNPILARPGYTGPGSFPSLTAGDRITLAVTFWTGDTGSAELTNARLTFDFLKLGSKVNKATDTLVLYADEWTESEVAGVWTYTATLDLNTVPLLDAIDGLDALELVSEIEVTGEEGGKLSFQWKHAVKQQVITNENPPALISQPVQVFFSGAYQAWLDDGNSGTVSDFLDTFDSTVPGPSGTMLGTGGVVEVSGNRNLLTSDDGKILWVGNASYTLTCDDALPVGFSCSIVSGYAGAGSYLTLSGANNSFGFTRTRAPWSSAQVTKIAPGVFILCGDLS